MENNKLSPGKKAKKTGRWAKTMTKWLITYSSKGSKKWQLVSFEGRKKRGENQEELLISLQFEKIINLAKSH